MAKKVSITKTALADAYAELDDVIGVEVEGEEAPDFAAMAVAKGKKELHEILIGLNVKPEEMKEFSKKTQSVFLELLEEFGEPDEEEEEEEEDPEEEEEEEEEDPDEEEEEEDPDEEEEEEEEEEDPAPKRTKNVVKKATSKTPAKKGQDEAPKKKGKPVPKQEGSMALFVDGLMEEGGTWDDLVEASKLEADKRGTKALSTKGMLMSHAKFRVSKGKTWKISEEGVNVAPKKTTTSKKKVTKKRK